ncbi:CAP domain-containing protein [Streptomyces sp. NPDC006283]|uniref:CAP domain-containing protein n=1 Tax=Streptomyces sp. NPDC006283 TaxID=3156741 RepID=UPI0033A832C7
MGRHRRSAPAPAATDHAAGPAGRHHGGAGRKKRAGLPVRTGLLGASTAIAVGAVLVTSGVLPGGDDKHTVGSSSDVRTEMRSEVPSRLQAQGDADAEPTASASPSRTPERSQAPSKSSTSPSHKASKTTEPSRKSESPKKSASAKPSKSPSQETSKTPEASKKTSTPTREASRTPERTVAPPKPAEPSKTPSPSKPAAPDTSSAAAAEADVIDLVNQERSRVGCSPLKASGELADLARAHSKDMAARNFFDHTNPDGETPWDRAEKAGVSGLGAENIARGQSDAEAVMKAWMSSEGHRANIRNCDFNTLGVGAHMADGGPWWTQNFGY